MSRSKLDRRELGLDLTNLVILATIRIGVTCRACVKGRVLVVTINAAPNVEVCHLIFYRCRTHRCSATTTLLTGLFLLNLDLRVVRRRMLAKDEMRSPELVDLNLPLLFRVEGAVQLLATADLLLEINVSHLFYFYEDQQKKAF